MQSGQGTRGQRRLGGLRSSSELSISKSKMESIELSTAPLGEAAAEMALEEPPPRFFLGALGPTLQAAPPSTFMHGILYSLLINYNKY